MLMSPNLLTILLDPNVTKLFYYSSWCKQNQIRGILFQDGIRWRHCWNISADLSFIVSIPLIPSYGMIICVLTFLFLKGSTGYFIFASILRFERRVVVRSIFGDFLCVDFSTFLVEKTDKIRETTKRKCLIYSLEWSLSTSHVQLVSKSYIHIYRKNSYQRI